MIEGELPKYSTEVMAKINNIKLKANLTISTDGGILLQIGDIYVLKLTNTGMIKRLYVGHPLYNWAQTDNDGLILIEDEDEIEETPI